MSGAYDCNRTAVDIRCGNVAIIPIDGLVRGKLPKGKRDWNQWVAEISKGTIRMKQTCSAERTHEGPASISKTLNEETSDKRLATTAPPSPPCIFCYI